MIAGSSAGFGGAVHIVPPMTIANAYVAPFAAAVKAKVKAAGVRRRPHQPAAGRGEDPRLRPGRHGRHDARDDLRSGDGEQGGGRTLDDIRACIGCNQACIGHFHLGYPISCIQHPETGRELTYGTLKPAARKKKVLIAGGGPGGMKAAAVAAERGHDVTLYEASERLGGQALLAQMLPGRAEFGGIVTNLSREMELAGAQVVMRTKVDARAGRRARSPTPSSSRPAPGRARPRSKASRAPTSSMPGR